MWNDLAPSLGREFSLCFHRAVSGTRAEPCLDRRLVRGTLRNRIPYAAYFIHAPQSISGAGDYRRRGDALSQARARVFRRHSGSPPALTGRRPPRSAPIPQSAAQQGRLGSSCDVRTSASQSADRSGVRICRARSPTTVATLDCDAHHAAARHTRISWNDERAGQQLATESMR
jgi:hypothetical protein